MCLQRDDLNMVMKVLQDDDGNGRLSPSARCGLSSLSLDQIVAILRFLPVQSISAFGVTCKRFWEIAEGDDLWAFICIREWGSQAVQTWPMLGKEKRGWKRVFRQMLMLKAGSWRKVDQGDVMPTARASHSLSTVAGKVTVFGGGCQGGRHLDDTWVASLPTEISQGVVWHQSSIGSPSGRFGQSCSVVDDSLVLFGGINDKGERQCDTWMNRGIGGRNLHESPAWELLDMVASPPPRGAHAGCFGGDGRVVIFGGIDTEGNRLGDTWVLELQELPSTWHEVFTPISPPARSGHTMTWIGGRKMILFGGRGTRFEVLNDVWLLDMDGDSAYWVELRPCELQPIYDRPTARAGHSATLIFGGRILIFGGEDARRARKGDVWVLDPRAGAQVGYGSSRMTSYPQKSLSEDKLAPRFWKKLKQWGQLPTRRSFHGACALESGHSILVFGGMVDGELFPGATGLGFDAEMHMLQLVP
ncbi:hypothetical protein M758_UG203700 [Ceratodon purpureus]|nr:hypothetical protein M758_UG203700 [Ceratodon purpureus]